MNFLTTNPFKKNPTIEKTIKDNAPAEDAVRERNLTVDYAAIDTLLMELDIASTQSTASNFRERASAIAGVLGHTVMAISSLHDATKRTAWETRHKECCQQLRDIKVKRAKVLGSTESLTTEKE